jgi:hypothetical protein
MKLNLIVNKKQDDIQSILYCAILFSDIRSITKILHPQGNFMGMSKARFIHSFKQYELHHHKSEGEMEPKHNFTTMISLHEYPGQRCFVLPMDSINGGIKGAYVFVMHPSQKKKVSRIVETGIYQEEKYFVSSALLFKKQEGKKYNFLYAN